MPLLHEQSLEKATETGDEGEKDAKTEGVLGLCRHRSGGAEADAQNKITDSGEGEKSQKEGDPEGDNNDENHRPAVRFSPAHHGDGDGVVLVGGGGEEEVNYHRHREAGECGDRLGLAGKKGVDHRMGDAHHLDVEEHREEEESDLLLRQHRRGFESRRLHARRAASSATVAARRSGVRPSSCPSPQAQKQVAIPAPCPARRSVW